MSAALRFEMPLTAGQERKVRMMARQDGMKPEEWLSREALKVAKKIFNESDWLSPKEAGCEVGLSHFTIKRYYHAGMFPNATRFNERVIRIPRSDLAKLMAERAVAVASVA